MFSLFVLCEMLEVNLRSKAEFCKLTHLKNDLMQLQNTVLYYTYYLTTVSLSDLLASTFMHLHIQNTKHSSIHSVGMWQNICFCFR